MYDAECTALLGVNMGGIEAGGGVGTGGIGGFQFYHVISALGSSRERGGKITYILSSFSIEFI